MLFKAFLLPLFTFSVGSAFAAPVPTAGHAVTARGSSSPGLDAMSFVERSFVDNISNGTDIFERGFGDDLVAEYKLERRTRPLHPVVKEHRKQSRVHQKAANKHIKQAMGHQATAAHHRTLATWHGLESVHHSVTTGNHAMANLHFALHRNYNKLADRYDSLAEKQGMAAWRHLRTANVHNLLAQHHP